MHRSKLPEEGTNVEGYMVIWVKLDVGYNSSKSHRYATMFFSKNCEWCSDVWYDVPQRIIILWKTLSQQAITSWSWPGGQVSLNQSCTTETGMSNSIHVFHWSAFSFPCPGFPKSWGGTWWHSGQMMLIISFCSNFSSCLVTLLTNTSCSFFPHAGCSMYASPTITTSNQLFPSFDATEDGEDDLLSWVFAWFFKMWARSDSYTTNKWPTLSICTRLFFFNFFLASILSWAHSSLKMGMRSQSSALVFRVASMHLVPFISLSVTGQCSSTCASSIPKTSHTWYWTKPRKKLCIVSTVPILVGS